ncbi:transposase [Thermodesulfobacteriota bacterium]
MHKKSISACLLSVADTGEKFVHQKTFRTFFEDLLRLRDWLEEHDCPVVAMESTGVYWKPVFNILEGYMEVVLVNAGHVKNVPGRKTDMSDSQWLANLLRHGLLRASFIPPQEVRQWRDWTRHRKKLVQSANDYKRRVHKLLQSAS